jgi:hypothetical protein
VQGCIATSCNLKNTLGRSFYALSAARFSRRLSRVLTNITAATNASATLCELPMRDRSGPINFSIYILFPASVLCVVLRLLGQPKQKRGGFDRLDDWIILANAVSLPNGLEFDWVLNSLAAGAAHREFSRRNQGYVTKILMRRRRSPADRTATMHGYGRDLWTLNPGEISRMLKAIPSFLLQ